MPEGAEQVWEQLQEQAAKLRKSGYEANASRGRNIAERATYLTLTIRIRDEQDADKG